MVALYLVVVVAVLLVAAAVATREDDVLVEAPVDAAMPSLPRGPLQPEDVGALRFGMVLRGYRMSEVDDVLDRLAAELAARDARVAELEQALVDVVEPQVVALEEHAAPVPEPVTEPVAAPVTEVVAETPAQVHAPVTDAPAPAPEDDLFPEVLAPLPAEDGLVDAQETDVREGQHEGQHEGPRPALGWPGEGAAVPAGGEHPQP